ncbi:MAG TPA: N-acetylmuramoyl-L-alanine amidase [Bacteroidia bacterium]|nr:N-acetylmuramoyl-L-alanine amidase [Bacteroidia bacterium]
MEIKNHRLADAEFKQTPNIGNPLVLPLPDTIVIHYTAGGSLQSSVATLCDPKSSASAHVVVGRDGKIVQLADFNVVTWHAGKSTMQDNNGKIRNGVNQYSIGIEIDNAGLLTKKEDGSFVSWFGKVYNSDEVVQGIHRNESVARYWHAYTEKQIETVNSICQALIAFYPIKYIAGHEEISPGRKTDPGPAFPLSKLRDRLLKAERKLDEPAQNNLPMRGIVQATSLNIRTRPELNADLKAKPLTQGTPVKILEEKDGWYRVEVVVEGWTSAKFIVKS